MSSPEIAELEFARMADLSTQLECLPLTSRGYGALLEDAVISHRSAATCHEITLLTTELPTPMVDAHHFPGRFTISGFKAEINRTRDPKTDDASWHFTANYVTDDNPYHLFADKNETVLLTENGAGAKLHYRFNPDMAAQFLAGIALGVLRCGESFVPTIEQAEAAALPDKITHLLYLIGTSHGQYGAQKTSFIEQVEQDRSLLITTKELENRTGSQQEHGYRLVCKIGETILADTSSQQSLSSNGSTVLATRFAERQPGYTEPQDLPFADLLRSDDELEGVLFEPTIDALEYTRVNAAIMSFLTDCLQAKKYQELDLLPSIEEIIEDEELTERYFEERDSDD